VVEWVVRLVVDCVLFCEPDVDWAASPAGVSGTVVEWAVSGGFGLQAQLVVVYVSQAFVVVVAALSAGCFVVTMFVYIALEAGWWVCGRVHVGCCCCCGGGGLLWRCVFIGEMTGGYSWSLVLHIGPII
jgi:hypothetical protein